MTLMHSKRAIVFILSIFIAYTAWTLYRHYSDVSNRRTKKRFAYVNLCADEASLFPSLILFYQLKVIRKCQAGDFILMVPEHLKSLFTHWDPIIEALRIEIFWLSKELYISTAASTKITTTRTNHTQEVKIFPIDFRPDSSFYQRPRNSSSSSTFPVLRERDARIWDKLRVWQLEHYDKVVLLDNDLWIAQNLDIAFTFPHISGVSMSDPLEKIAFFQVKKQAANSKDSSPKLTDSSTPNPENFQNLVKLQEKIVNETGLNSGFLVITPSISQLIRMITILKAMKQRPCCPSQEFIWHYFEGQGKFHRLDQTWNLRRLEHLPLESIKEKSTSPETNCTSSKEYLVNNVKIFHFVEKGKPHHLFVSKAVSYWTRKISHKISHPPLNYEDFVHAWIKMALLFLDDFKELLPPGFLRE